MNTLRLYHVNGTPCVDRWSCPDDQHMSIPPICAGLSSNATADALVACDLPAGHPGPHFHAATAREWEAVTFPGRPQEVRRVRAVLRRILGGCPAADDVLLCASELAANAILHSDTRETGGTFTVRAEVSPADYVTVEVEDDGGRWIDRGPESSRGRGLDILRALATDWGVRSSATGRTVWARFGWHACESWPTGELSAA